MMLLTIVLGVALIGCSHKPAVVWREPKILIGKEYYKRDGSKCREVKVIREFEDRTEVEIKEVCVR